MASSSIGGIFAELTLRDSKFSKGLKSAGASLAKFGASAARYGTMAASAMGSGLVAGVKHTIDMGGALTDLSAQTGVAIDDLMKIGQAYEDNGKSADSAGKDINKMQKTIAAAGGDKDPFAKIGISVDALKKKNPSEQFFEIADAINKIKDPTEKTAAAMSIFGKSGGELLAVFAGSDMESVTQSLGMMPEIMKEFAAELDHAGDLLGRLPNKSDQFFTGFSAGIIEHIIPGLESVDGYDFTTLGKNLGDNLGGAIKHAAFLLNVAFDTLSGEGLGASIDKYSKAFDDIDKEYAEDAAKRKDDAAYEKARLEEYKNAPDYVNPNDEGEMGSRHDELAKYQKASVIDWDAPKEKAAKIETIRSANLAPAYDSYQSRGLSLSKSPTDNKEQKQLDVQIEIRRLLERFIEGSDGEIKWT